MQNVECSVRKGEELIQTNTNILTFNQSHTPKEGKIGYCLERVAQYIPVPGGASNAKNMDTTGKPVEDDRHVPNAVKKTQTTWRKIALSKDMPTPTYIYTLTQISLPSNRYICTNIGLYSQLYAYALVNLTHTQELIVSQHRVN